MKIQIFDIYLFTEKITKNIHSQKTGYKQLYPVNLYL